MQSSMFEASICGELLAKAAERNSICANATRLYKYLIRDYLEEFSANLKQHIADTMRVVGPDDPLVVDGLGRAKALQLQALYGCDTLPDDLLEVFNAGVSQWVHVSAAGLDAAALMSKAFYILHKYILFIEEHPVPTRFWLYGKCVAGMLRMNLLGVPADIFRLRFVRPCEEGGGRLAKYTTWHCSPEAGSSLRIAALCLRLTTHALNITAQKHDGDHAREPTLLRLARGEVQTKAAQDLSDMLPRLSDDPELDIARSVLCLLVAFAHLLMRFGEYLQYPFKLWRLVEKWNPGVRCVNAMEDLLLSTHDDELDAGYTKVLKRDALALGSHADALHFLSAPCMQAELESVFNTGQATSLDVERRHAQDKRGERGKVMTVSRASRNSVLRRWLLIRERLMKRKRVEKKYAKRKPSRTNIRALAVKRNTHLLPRARGKLHWESGVTGAMRAPMTHSGDETALKAYIADHRNELIAERDAKRSKCVAPTDDDVGEYPVLKKDLLSWFERHDQQFRNRLKTASAARVALSHRIFNDGSSLPPAPRIYPKGGAQPVGAWRAKLAQCRQGWFAFAIPGAAPSVFFCACLRQHSRAFLLEKLEANLFRLDVKRVWDEALTPVEDAVVSMSALYSLSDYPFLKLILALSSVGSAERQSVLHFTVVSEKDVELHPRRPAYGKKSASEDASGTESEAEAALVGSDTEASVVSEREADAELEAEEVEACPEHGVDDEDPAADPTAAEPVADGKVKAGWAGLVGMYRVNCDGYFTTVNNPNFNNIKILMLPRWQRAVPDGMGVGQWSKTLKITDYDDDEHAPKLAFLVADSWKLLRSKRDGFVDALPIRQAWYSGELASLRARIAALSATDGRTGNAAADRLIAQLCPEVFAV